MLKSPRDLQAAAQRAAEQTVAKEAKSVEEREKLDRLRKEFEAACLSAALRRKTQISFDEAVAKMADLHGFAIEKIKRDRAREQFLASKIAEAEGQIALKLDGLAAAHPSLVTKVFPNRLAKNFRTLVDRCVNQETAEDVVAGIKRQLCLVTSFNSETWEAFEGKCLSLASDCLLLEAVRFKHAKVAEINAAIPDGLNTALRISWGAAVPDFGKAGAFSASKLSWISTVWPRWERHFNADIESAASKGQTSRAWLFFSAWYWGEDNSFVVDVEGLPKPDVDSMSQEERRIHIYWKEIDERDGKVQRYNEDEGVLIGVHPLPVAEIFSFQGFQVTLEERRDEDLDGNVTIREISMADLDECSVDLSYQLQVSWRGS